MTREEMADEIELFCNTAPDYSYLVRFDATKTALDTFIWVRCIPNIDAIVKNVPDSWDVIMFKSEDGLLGMGHYKRYLTDDGKTFDKEYYVNPD